MARCRTTTKERVSRPWFLVAPVGVASARRRWMQQNGQTLCVGSVYRRVRCRRSRRLCSINKHSLSTQTHTQWHARLCALGRSRLGVVAVGRDPARTVRLVVSLSLFQLSRQGHEHATRSTAVKFVVGVVNDHFLVPSDVLVCDNEIDDRFAAAIDQLPLAAF